MPQDIIALHTVLKAKGTKRNIEKYLEEQLNLIDSLKGEVKVVLQAIHNLHPDFNNDYNFYNGMPRYELAKNILSNDEIWLKNEYKELWGGFFPLQWQDEVVMVWKDMPIYNRIQLFYVLGTNWIYNEVDLYDLLDYYGYQFYEACIFENCYLNKLDNNDMAYVSKVKSILQNESETGTINELLIQTILKSKQPGLWEDLKTLLLAAQRQEGLRQAIIKNINIGKSESRFIFIKTILENDLLRYTSVLRKIEYWFSLPIANGKSSTDKEYYAYSKTILEIYHKGGLNSDLILKNKNLTEAYFQIWVLRETNTKLYWQVAEEIMSSNDVVKHAIVLHTTASLGLKGFLFAKKYSKEAKDLSVRWNIWKNFQSVYGDEPYDTNDGVFEFYEHLITDIPTAELKNNSPSFSWDSYHFVIRDLCIQWIYRVGRATKRIKDILPYENRLPSQEKGGLLQWHFEKEYFEITGQTKSKYNFTPSEFERNWIVRNIQDKSSSVYNGAFIFYNALTPFDHELPILYDLLRKKSDDIRRHILSILQSLPDEQKQNAIETLLNEKTEEQQLAGLDLLQQLKKSDKLKEFVDLKIEEYSTRKKIGSKAELILHDLIDNRVIIQEDDGYGLYRSSIRPAIPVMNTPSTGFFVEMMYGKPMMGISISEDKLKAEVIKLDALVTANENYEYEAESYNKTKRTIILGQNYYLESIQYINNIPTYEQKIKLLPLGDLWMNWFKESGLTHLDLYILQNFNNHYRCKDNNLIPRWLAQRVDDYTHNLNNAINNTNEWKLKYNNLTSSILGHLRNDPSIQNQIVEIELDATIHFFAQISTAEMHSKFHLYEAQDPIYTWREIYKAFQGNFEMWEGRYQDQKSNIVNEMSDTTFIKFWNAYYWFYRNLEKSNVAQYNSPQANTIGRAHQLGLIDTNEVHFFALEIQVWTMLCSYSNIEIQKTLKQYPVFKNFLDDAIPRILEIELKRGDTPTAVTKFAMYIQEIRGIDYFIKIIKGLGKDTLVRGYSYNIESKKAMFSRFLKASKPNENEDYKEFKSALDKLNLSESRLLEFALYAPSWLAWTEKYLDWQGLQSAAWCLHAHAHHYFDLQKESELAKYTTISTQDFQDGGVDVAWYKSAYDMLHEDKFQKVHEAAHIICDNNGYIRARAYADCILGKISLEDCTLKINDKRNKDYVVGIGLIPLDAKNKEEDILNRYKFLQTFKIQSKEFGQQRQSSEKRVVELAMDNLARNAGYPDPMRLTWAMETLEVKSLLARAQSLNIDDTEIVLQITSDGKAEVKAIKKEKTLVNLPSSLKKHTEVTELIEIKNALNAQHNRIKKSLEEAMIRGDSFESKEMEMLQDHPIIESLFGNLLWISDKGNIDFYKNFPKQKTYRIAHCIDLYESGLWSHFQNTIFKNQIVQPFKQVFRELYIPTQDEVAAQGISNRYVGYQVNPNQAGALFRSRGWAANYYEGMQKNYHKEKISVQVEIYADWFNPQNASPADIYGVRFFHKLSGDVIAIKDVPRIVFTEVMRDLDLVVSFAHIGGVDIEASLSSMELRAAIVQETAALFDLQNVSIEKSHIFIKGSRGEYTIHLGSGIVHQRPARMLNIEVVSTQARGRIFLPFVDEDPRTAEIVSKVLLLAKDKDLKDPGLLGQMG